MKIMLVSRVVPAHRPGGMPHVVMDRAEALAKAGHEVHVVTTRLSGGGIETTNGVEVNYTNSPPEKWSKEFAICCEATAEHIKPNVLHLDSFDAANPWWVGKKTSITMHGFGFGAFLTKWNLFRLGRITEREMDCGFDEDSLMKERSALAKAHSVIGVSRWEWRMLRDQYGLRQAKLVYNPIAPYFFDDAVCETCNGLRTVDETLGGCATANPEAPCPDCPSTNKRTYFLCAAVSQGDTRGFGVVKDAARIAGVEIRTADKVERKDMPALYEGAKALVLATSFCQGYDLAVAEARARGCPAILSPTGSCLDEAKPWDTFTEIGDTEGLEDILRGWNRTFVPLPVPITAADEHRPERHAEEWLAAVE